MDQFLDWLDANTVFVVLRHAWPWALVTASLAVVSLSGIVTVARRYGDAMEHAPFFDSALNSD